MTTWLATGSAWLRRRSLTLWWYGLGLSGVVLLILSFDLINIPSVDVTVGQPAAQTIEAPRTISYVSTVLTERAREQAAARVAPVYEALDRDIGRTQTNRATELLAFMDVVRADAHADSTLRAQYLTAVDVIPISAELAQDLLALRASSFAAVKQETLRIIDEVMRAPIREGTPFDALRLVQAQMGFQFTPEQEAAITALAAPFITPNQKWDEVTTEQQRSQARTEVQPVTQTIIRGVPIVNQGERVTAEDMEALEHMGLVNQTHNWLDIARLAVVVVLIVVAILLYWERYQQAYARQPRYLALLALLLILGALGIQLLLARPGLPNYLFPAAGLAMAMTVFFDYRLAALFTLALGGLAGYVSDLSLSMTFYVTVGTLIGAYFLRDTDRLSAYFRAGLLTALGNVVIILVFQTSPQRELNELAVLAGLGVANGIISASLSLVLFFAVGSLLGIVTIFQLQDLGRFDQPLLQELLRQAPGTYHHSIMVANMAEQAAQRIGAHSLLVRVGAFYHDVGKITQAPYFTENQTPGVNPHDQLDPYTSAAIIHQHVADGLVLARRYHLPSRIQDFIAEHHGDRLVWGFYRKAVEQADGDEKQVDINRFRYSGPRPRSRETALVHLADAVEASSKAVQPSNGLAIEKLVGKILEESQREGQLDEAQLTVGDLHQIRDCFIESLQGRFHVRVQYPGNEELLATNGNIRQVPASEMPTPAPSTPPT